MSIPKVVFAGSGERMQYLTHKNNDTTVRFVLKYPGLVDPDVLCAAVRSVVMSVDILHGTFFTDTAAAYWKINADMDDNNFFRYIRTEGDPMVTAKSLSVYPVYHEDKCQLRCELVQNDTDSAITLCISHLCVDGSDGKYLLGKIVEAYNSILANGNADALSVKDGNRAPEKIYANVDLKDVKGLFRMPVSTKASSAYPFPTEEAGMCRVTTSVIPADIMTAARKKAKTVNASANDLLLAAAYQVYAGFPEVDRSSPISISSMMDLRRHCKDGESEGLCNMSGGMPTELLEGVSEDFSDTLTKIAQQTASVKEDPTAGMGGMPLIHGALRTMPIGLLLTAIAKIYGNAPVGLTNLGNIPCETLSLGSLTPTEGVFGGPLKKKPGFQISIMSFDGECVLACYGQYTARDASHIQSTLDAMVQTIADYVKE